MLGYRHSQQVYPAYPAQPRAYAAPYPVAAPQSNRSLMLCCILAAVIALMVILALGIGLPLGLRNENNMDDYRPPDYQTCRNNPCNQGTCRPNEWGFQCECVNGYTGRYCELAPPKPVCDNGRLSEDGLRCICEPGYTGDRCQIDVDECATKNGGCEGTCRNTVGSFVCTCPEGEKLALNGFSCRDIDECDNNPCKFGVCVDGTADYTCQCQDGYTGKDCDEDLNECAANVDLCQKECINYIGSYQCDCPLGYVLDNNALDCVPQQRCVDNLCKNGGTCMNTDTGVHCDCPSAYDGLYCQFDVDECLTNNGGCSHSCHDEIGGFTCSCQDGYMLSENGADCLEINYCADSPCERGECINVEMGYKCLCPHGFTGMDCEMDINECDLDDKSWCMGICENYIGGYSCSCPPGQMMLPNNISCVDIRECADNPCVNGACIEGDNSFTCSCNEGFGGEFCETEYCDTETGWLYNRRTKHCYKYISQAQIYPDYEVGLTWYGAGTYCQQQGGYLVSINDDRELAFVHDYMLLVANGKVYTTDSYEYHAFTWEEVYLGLWVGDHQDPSTWRFTDGSAIDFSVLHWNDGEPSTSSTYSCSHFATGYLNQGTMRHDLIETDDCDEESRSFICEIANQVDGVY